MRVCLCVCLCPCVSVSVSVPPIHLYESETRIYREKKKRSYLQRGTTTTPIIVDMQEVYDTIYNRVVYRYL